MRGIFRVKKVERQSNIELLRIFAMIGVIILHYISSPGHVLENVIEGGGENLLYCISE